MVSITAEAISFIGQKPFSGFRCTSAAGIPKEGVLWERSIFIFSFIAHCEGSQFYHSTSFKISYDYLFTMVCLKICFGGEGKEVGLCSDEWKGFLTESWKLKVFRLFHLYGFVSSIVTCFLKNKHPITLTLYIITIIGSLITFKLVRNLRLKESKQGQGVAALRLTVFSFFFHILGFIMALYAYLEYNQLEVLLGGFLYHCFMGCLSILLMMYQVFMVICCRPKQEDTKKSQIMQIVQGVETTQTSINTSLSISFDVENKGHYSQVEMDSGKTTYPNTPNSPDTPHIPHTPPLATASGSAAANIAPNVTTGAPFVVTGTLVLELGLTQPQPTAAAAAFTTAAPQPEPHSTVLMGVVVTNATQVPASCASVIYATVQAPASSSYVAMY